VNEDESRTLFAVWHESRSYVSITHDTGLFGITHACVLTFSPMPVYFGNLTETGYLENMNVERRTVQNRSSRNKCDKVELGSCGLTLVLCSD
jgi:hypothetical protein